MKEITSKLYKRADKEMTEDYETALLVLEQATSTESRKTLKLMTLGEFEGTYDMAVGAYLELIYEIHNETAEDEKEYYKFCEDLRKRQHELEELLRNYCKRYSI